MINLQTKKYLFTIFQGRLSRIIAQTLTQNQHRRRTKFQLAAIHLRQRRTTSTAQNQVMVIAPQ